MKTKLFACALSCILIFRPAAVVNSQPDEKVLQLNELRQKEAQNELLRQSVKAKEQEINALLSQLIAEKKALRKATRKPIYKRIFQKKKPKPGLITETLPVKKIDPTIDTIQHIDTLAPPPVLKKKQRFFKRLFNNIFKRKNKQS